MPTRPLQAWIGDLVHIDIVAQLTEVGKETYPVSCKLPICGLSNKIVAYFGKHDARQHAIISSLVSCSCFFADHKQSSTNEDTANSI